MDSIEKSAFFEIVVNTIPSYVLLFFSVSVRVLYVRVHFNRNSMYCVTVEFVLVILECICVIIDTTVLKMKNKSFCRSPSQKYPEQFFFAHHWV